MRNYKPIAILLLSSGSHGGDKLLFRYPFDDGDQTHVDDNSLDSDGLEKTSQLLAADVPASIYSLKNLRNWTNWKDDQKEKIGDTFNGLSDRALVGLLPVKLALCGEPFELKFEDIYFVGYPVQIQRTDTFNLLFAISEDCGMTVLHGLQRLAQRLSAALEHEDRRVNYLRQQKDVMVDCLDSLSSMSESSRGNPFKIMCSEKDKYTLACKLKKIYDDICKYGSVDMLINNWVRVSHCMQFSNKRKEVLPKIRPYHAILLLVELGELIPFPLDSNPALQRLISVSTPMKNLQVLCSDADLSLYQAIELVEHLVYWGKVKVIFPLAEKNVYVLNQSENYPRSLPELVENFAEKFPNESFYSVLGTFSLPSPLEDISPRVPLVIWMLANQLIKQVHTYVYFLPNKKCPVWYGQRKSTRFNKMIQNSGKDELSMAQEQLESGTGLSNTYSENSELYPDFHNPQLDMKDNEEFERLIPYFDGRSHFEEIMFFENMNRSDLKTLIDKFRDVLLLCEHEDPDICV